MSLESGWLAGWLRGRLRGQGCAEHPARPGGAGGALGGDPGDSSCRRDVPGTAEEPCVCSQQGLGGAFAFLPFTSRGDPGSAIWFLGPGADAAHQEHLEDVLHVPRGAKSSLQPCWAAPSSCALHPTVMSPSLPLALSLCRGHSRGASGASRPLSGRAPAALSHPRCP